ncbi:MAG: CCA tRNA nucleotidyltransferase [Patescibacteria group bacterium]|jgi:poly(A) polymerase
MENKQNLQKNLPTQALSLSKSVGEQIKPFINQLAKKFPPAEVFLVGGAVRDAILNRPTNDFDFVVRLVNKAALEKFLATQGKVSLVGKRFGVFKFRPKLWEKEEIDIALPRTEHSASLSGAYHDFKIASNAKLNIEADLSRRDFTINAMAYKISTNLPAYQPTSLLIDPFNGLADINKKIIRAVGDPQKRFQEDYSRMLRAIRFATQLGFKIETKTWQAIVKGIKNIDKIVDNERIVPAEVIAKELIKTISADPVLGLKLLDQSGAIKILIPELLKMKKCPQPKNFHSEGDCWRHTVLALNNLKAKKFKKEFGEVLVPAEIKWGLLFHDIGKPDTIIRADRLRFNNHDNVSAQKFCQIADRLKLASAGLDIDLISKIISKHMLPTHTKSAEMKDTTIEKYFFNPDFPGRELLMLIFADILATVPPSGRPDFSSYQKLQKHIKKLGKTSLNKKELPKPLVNGHDLIKKFKLVSSPKIGKYLAILREAQLRGKIKTKDQGLNYIKKYL